MIKTPGQIRSIHMEVVKQAQLEASRQSWLKASEESELKELQDSVKLQNNMIVKKIEEEVERYLSIENIKNSLKEGTTGSLNVSDMNPYGETAPCYTISIRELPFVAFDKECLGIKKIPRTLDEDLRTVSVYNNMGMNSSEMRCNKYCHPYERYIQSRLEKVVRRILGPHTTVFYCAKVGHNSSGIIGVRPADNAITIRWVVPDDEEEEDAEDEDVSKEITPETCVACNDKKKSMAGKCGHLCLCNECSDTIVSTSKKCPICRQPWVDVRVIY